MIEHVYRRAAEARGVDAVVVATDDSRIAAAVERFGGIVRMTAATHRTGTDRIAEIARTLECDILVNVQGDLPLVEPEMIAQVVAPLKADPAERMSTVCTPLTDPAEYTRPSVVKVVVDRTGHALYFSRSPIPYRRPDDAAEAGPAEAGLHGANAGPAEAGLYGANAGTDARSVESGFSRTYKHIGMYAFRREFLLEYAALAQTPLEQAESLEQLRALEHGFRIRVVETQYESIEIDTPDDLERVRRLLAEEPRSGANSRAPSTARTQDAVEAFR
jgi:3-deoxy-manno-octulosonate cytidylyltransferase (CMP-KDO synthetase)